MRAKIKVVLMVVLILAGVGLMDADGYAVEAASDAGKQYAQASVAIAVAPAVDLEVLPQAGGTVGYAVTDLVVSTTGTEGYRVLLNVNKPSLTNKHHADEIKMIDQAIALVQFPVNSWGVYLGANKPSASSVFSPIDTTPQEFAKNDLADASGAYKLTVGAKADTSLPAGVYTGEIVISVVAEPKIIETRTIQDIGYMQDITPEICANSKIWESAKDSKKLVDKRDGTEYQVARLKDGNCWMQSNLNLNLYDNKALTPEDSDVQEEWTPSLTTKNYLTNNSAVDGQESWHIGYYWYYQWNAATAGSGEKVLADGAEAENSICPKGWRLPLSKEENNGKSGSFYKLIQNYGLLGNAYNTMLAPLSFAPCGIIYVGATNGFNEASEFWSRVSRDAGTAYVAQFLPNLSGTTSVRTTTYAGREYGISVRCVVTVGD